MPLLYDPFVAIGERAGMSNLRRQLVSAAEGRVLELGAGTGLNVAHYPPSIQELVLSEPEPAMAARLRRRSRLSAARTQVVQAGAEELPFDAGSFDTVVCTFVLCTVPDPASALLEARRVLAEHGRLLFLEHVRAPDGSALARWQDRLEHPWRAFASGCRCNQDTVALVEAAPFRVSASEPARWRGMPALVRPVVLGEAVALSGSG
ncbi:MAG TPA: class I SAM-dependent methyltransferase [Solirubrobacteraceae bacterium]|nr:class I SAM-dependent methyltransferase [Solirubrobacteraceae bacterium]